MLLNLPTELIQIILGFTSPSAYIQAAVCCRSLYTIALDSRDLILAHLQRTPGKKDGFTSYSTPELFRLLQIRVEELLLNATFYADRTTYTFNGKKQYDVGASSIGRIGEYSVLALVYKEDPQVHLVYVDFNGVISSQRSIDCSPQAPEECPGIVVKTTFASNNSLAVLVRGQMIDEKKDVHHVFRESMQEHGDDTFYYYLFIVPLTEDYLYSFASVCRIYGRADFQPEAFACTTKSKIQFAISWQCLRDDWHNEVVLYRAWKGDSEVVEKQNDLCYLEYSESTIVDENGHHPPKKQIRASWANFERKPLWKSGPVKKIQLCDSQVFHSYKGSALFDYSQTFPLHNWGLPSAAGERVFTSLENLSDVQTFDMPFAVSAPFFRRHEVTGNDTCDHQFLSFGTATDPTKPWTACLLKNRDEFQYRTCGIEPEFEPEWEPLFEDRWIPIARLRGYQRPSMSTTTCSPATSLQGTRIAVANWDVVYVWALNPEELTDKGLKSNTFYPRAWWSDDDEDGDYPMVELRPVVFRLDAVCFNIMFTENEDIIMALTDKGLVTLDLRPQCQGRRLTLDMDIS